MTLFPREYMTRRALLPALSDPDVERAAEAVAKGDVLLAILATESTR